MSAEAIVYDRLESETIPVAGAEQQPQQQENLDDPNVQVPEGMERLQVIFKVKKPDEKLDEEESLGLDAASIGYCKNVGMCARTGKPHCANPGNCIQIDGEWHDFKAYSAIAQDAKKSLPSPNKRKVATTWADCKAKDKATCPYHGAAFMRDKFNEIFKKHGVENAEVRIAPWVDTEGEADPSYSMYFNLPKKFDKKQLQKIFNEMMSTVKGVGELNAEDAITHHSEPEDRELTYDIEAFDPNIDPNEEMAADLAKEKATEEAKKKAEAEAAKKAEEEAKKKAAEEAKKKASQLTMPKAENGEYKAEYPTDAADELAYLLGFSENRRATYVSDSTKKEAEKALDSYAEQMKSLATIEQKAQTTKNPETKAVLERLAKKSKENLAQKMRIVEAARDNYVNDMKAEISDDLAVTDSKLNVHDDIYGKGGLQEEITELYSALANDNRLAYHDASAERSKRISEEKKRYDKLRDDLTMMRNYVERDMNERGRLDDALSVIDSKEYTKAESDFQDAANKLYADLIESRNALREAVDRQEEEQKAFGHTATDEDVDKLMSTITSKNLHGEQLELFKKGMRKMPAAFVRSMSKGVEYVKGKGGVCKAFEVSAGHATIETTKNAEKYIGITLAHELGHAYLYRHGLSRHKNPVIFKPYGKKMMKDFKVPEKITALTESFESEGRELIKTVFGKERLSVKGKSDNSHKLHEYLSQFDYFKGTNYYFTDGSSTEKTLATKNFWILSDTLGCVNKGGFYGHTNKNYASEFGRTHEMLAQGISALTGNVPLMERFFPKSLAKLREFVANDVANV